MLLAGEICDDGRAYLSSVPAAQLFCKSKAVERIYLLKKPSKLLVPVVILSSQYVPNTVPALEVRPL